MKTLVLVSAVLLLICLVNSVVASHNRHHRGKAARNHEDDSESGADSEWPSPSTISDFTVPDAFTAVPGDDGETTPSGDENPPARHHGKSHRRSHKN